MMVAKDGYQSELQRIDFIIVAENMPAVAVKDAQRTAAFSITAVA
jgi:hypothetical protein